jgi:cysteine synthase
MIFHVMGKDDAAMNRFEGLLTGEGSGIGAATGAAFVDAAQVQRAEVRTTLH